MPIVFRTTGTLAVPEFLVRRGGGVRPVALPLTCAIVPRPDGLLVIDTGWSRAQCAFADVAPGRLARVLHGMRVRPEDALASQIISLGHDPRDVKHIVATNLRDEHIAGAVDFPEATVHTTATEWDARQSDPRAGYPSSPAPYVHRLELHAFDGPPALGFAASHDLFGDGTVLLLDAAGPTAGALAVAVKLEQGWFVHAGDACVTRAEFASEQGPWLYARRLVRDTRALERTHTALRVASKEPENTVIPSRDPEVFATLPTANEQGWKGAWEQGKKKPQNANGKAQRPPQNANGAAR